MRNQKVIDALFAHNIETLSELIDKGQFNVNEGIDYGRLAISICAACDYIELIKFLVSKGADLNKNNEDNLGYTPLEEAAREGKYNAAKLLLNLGADINRGNSINSNALIGACIAADKEMVKLLIENGADVNHIDNQGQTALHYLSFYVARWLGETVEIKNNDKAEIIANPRYESYLEIYKYLIEKGGDIYKQTNYGYTPLHLAAESNCSDFIKILIFNGINVNIPNSNGFTPIHAAADNSSLESLKLLIKYGANVNAEDSYGFTPLISAISNDNIKMVKYLLKQHAHKNIKVKKNYGNVKIGDDAKSLAGRSSKKTLKDLIK